MSLNEAVFLGGGKGKNCLSGEAKTKRIQDVCLEKVKSHNLFLEKTNNKTKHNTFSFILYFYVICFVLVIIILLFLFLLLCFLNFSFLLFVCVCVFPPFLFFYSSSPFLFSLSCAPFLFISLVFFLSVKISSFSTSSSMTRFFSPCFIVVVLCFCFFFFPMFLPSSSWYSCSSSCFFLNSGFQKTHHRNQNAYLTKFWWGPETPIFVVVSGEQAEEAEEAEISKTPIQRCTRNGLFFGTPPGRAVRWKSRKTLKYTMFKGRHPIYTQFSKATTYVMKK